MNWATGRGGAPSLIGASAESLITVDIDISREVETEVTQGRSIEKCSLLPTTTQGFVELYQRQQFISLVQTRPFSSVSRRGLFDKRFDKDDLAKIIVPVFGNDATQFAKILCR